MVVMKPKEIGDADFANYFCTYGYLYHQKDMLEDQARMTAYHNAVRMNPRSFKDKVVLDVGTGSGIRHLGGAERRQEGVRRGGDVHGHARPEADQGQWSGPHH